MRRRAARYDHPPMSTINKNDLTKQIAEETGVDSGQAKLAVDKALDIIVQRVAAGDEVNLAGFGKFSRSERQAREGRNPATGETIQIAASKGLKFSAAKAAKDAVNG
jgi:DNA-binding protein HU-beta